jgi:hypothetical protein
MLGKNYPAQVRYPFFVAVVGSWGVVLLAAS